MNNADFGKPRISALPPHENLMETGARGCVLVTGSTMALDFGVRKSQDSVEGVDNFIQKTSSGGKFF